MRMRVDEARDDRLVRAVQHLCSSWSRDTFGDTGYAVALDEDIGELVLVKDVLNKDGHSVYGSLFLGVDLVEFGYGLDTLVEDVKGKVFIG